MAKSFYFKTRVHKRAMAIKDWPFVDTMTSLTKDTSRNCLACFWVNYNDLTTTSLEIMVSKGNHPQMASIQVSELL